MVGGLSFDPTYLGSFHESQLNSTLELLSAILFLRLFFFYIFTFSAFEANIFILMIRPTLEGNTQNESVQFVKINGCTYVHMYIGTY